jgi:ketosteroid isomerase-like protein
MSSGNVEIVRSIYEAFNRRDWDAVFRDQHPEGQLLLPPGAINQQIHRGREEIQAYWQDMLSTFEWASVEPDRLIEKGDQLVAIVKIRVQPKGTSAEIEITNGHLWTLRDGKTVSMRLFPEPEKALEAAGLQE